MARAKLTTSQFVERSRAKHGDFYDYSKSEYTKSSAKLCIICPKHGEFWQIAQSHYLAGKGCAKCRDDGNAKRFSSNESAFIEKARAAHGDTYDYSKVQYNNNGTKVTIACKEHGDFNQTPSHHLYSGNGCPTCAGRVSPDYGFFEKAREAHGDRYDYSETVYKGARESLAIRCREHGVFWQLAGSHTTGKGCDECAKIKRGRIRSDKSRSAFLESAIKVHGEKYVYRKTLYRSAHVKAEIECPRHGVFEQTLASHLSGSGCPKCAGKGLSDDQWVDRAKETHGDKYDYSKTRYTKVGEKSTITCPTHGDFDQNLIDHVSGRGCPQCPQKRHLPCHVYIMDSGEGSVKVGVSRVIGYRIYQLNRGGQPFTCWLHSSREAANKRDALDIERLLHEQLKTNGSGFTGFDGATEWFNVSPDYAEALLDKAFNEMEIQMDSESEVS